MEADYVYACMYACKLVNILCLHITADSGPTWSTKLITITYITQWRYDPSLWRKLILMVLTKLARPVCLAKHQLWVEYVTLQKFVTSCEMFSPLEQCSKLQEDLTDPTQLRTPKSASAIHLHLNDYKPPWHFAPRWLDFDTPLISIATLPQSLPPRPHSWLPSTNPPYFTLP